LDDISWILKLYMAAMAISIICFMSEIAREKWRRRRELKN